MLTRIQDTSHKESRSCETQNIGEGVSTFWCFRIQEFRICCNNHFGIKNFELSVPENLKSWGSSDQEDDGHPLSL
jgi:hypothetical protein